MNRNIIIILCCAILVSIPAFTYSADGFYMSGNIGIAAPSDPDVVDSDLPGVSFVFDLDKGWAAGVAGGYSFSNNLRLEGEILHQRNPFKNITYGNASVPLNGDVTNFGLLLNAYCDLINSSNFVSFLSGGIGYDKIEFKNMSIPGLPTTPESYDDTIFVFHMGGGVGYVISSKVIIDLKYRYLVGSDPEFGTTEAEFISHNFYVGIRYTF